MNDTISVLKEQLRLVMELAGDRINSESYFNYSWMNPQHRLAVENAYIAISDLLEESDNDTPTE